MKKHYLRTVSFILSIAVFLSATIISSANSVTDDKTGANIHYAVPSLKSDLIVPLNKVVEWWSSAFSANDITGGGVTLNWPTNDLGIRFGLMQTFPLNKLTINLNNFTRTSTQNGLFAIILSNSLNAADMDPSQPVCGKASIVLVVDTKKGKIYFANSAHNGTSFNTSTNGTEIYSNDLLKYNNIKGKPFSISFSDGDDGAFNLIVSTDEKTTESKNAIKKEMLSSVTGIYDTDYLYVALSSWKYSKNVSVDFESIGPVRVNTASLTEVSSDIMGITESELNNWWFGRIKMEKSDNGGLKFRFTNAFRNIRQSVVRPQIELDGMQLGFDNLSPLSCVNEYPKLSLIFSQSNPQCEAVTGTLMLIIDTAEGNIVQVADSDYVSKNTVILSDPKIKQLIGRPFTVSSKKSEDKYILHISTDKFDLETELKSELAPDFDPKRKSFVGITPAAPEGGSHSFIVDWYDIGTLKATVESVTAAIDAIGTVTLSDGSKIRKARELYEQLSDSKKSLIGNYSILRKAESRYALLVEDADADLVKMSKSSSMLLGSGNASSYDTIAVQWATYLSLADIETGGLRYCFTGAFKDIREGCIDSVTLDGLYLQFDNITTESSSDCGFTLYFGNTKPPYGPESSHNPLILTLDTAKGRILANPSETEILSSDILKIENISGQRFSYYFEQMDSGEIEVTVSVNDETVSGVIPESVFESSTNLTNRDKCYVMITNWTPSTYNVDFIGYKQLKKTAAQVMEMIDNIGIVTIESGGLINEAFEEYEKLSDISKASVTNYQILEAAKEYYDSLDYNEMIKSAETLIDEIGEVSCSSGNKIDAIEILLDRMSNKQKSEVKNIEKYNADVKEYYKIIKPMMNIETAVDGFGVGANAVRVSNGSIPSWSDKMVSTLGDDSSLHIEWKDAIRDMRNGATDKFQLNGLYLRWANLTPEKEKSGACLSVQIGTEDDYKEDGGCMAFVFDTEAGTLTGYPVNRLMLESKLLKQDNIEGKEVSMKFIRTEENVYLLKIRIGDDTLKCTVPSTMILDPSLQIKSMVKASLSPWVNNSEGRIDASAHTFSVDFLSIRSGGEYAFESFYKTVNKIDNLPKKATLSDEEIIADALEQYRNLPKKLRASVSNYQKLESALNGIYELQQDDYAEWQNIG